MMTKQLKVIDPEEPILMRSESKTKPSEDDEKQCSIWPDCGRWRQDKTRHCKTRYMTRVKIKRQVTGDGMRMKTIDKEGVLKLKELKTRILSMKEKLEPFINIFFVS